MLLSPWVLRRIYCLGLYRLNNGLLAFFAAFLWTIFTAFSGSISAISNSIVSSTTFVLYIIFVILFVVIKRSILKELSSNAARVKQPKLQRQQTYLLRSGIFIGLFVLSIMLLVALSQFGLDSGLLQWYSSNFSILFNSSSGIFQVLSIGLEDDSSTKTQKVWLNSWSMFAWRL